VPTRDTRGYDKPNVGGKPANAPIDMTVPGSGKTAHERGENEKDPRSAAHYAEGFPGKPIPSDPGAGGAPTGGRSGE
jgi:hypothetical protein